MYQEDLGELWGLIDMGKAVITIETYNEGLGTRLNYLPKGINQHVVVGVLRGLVRSIEENIDKNQNKVQRRIP